VLSRNTDAPENREVLRLDTGLDVETITSLLSQHGFKHTRQRRAVLEVIAGARTRMTPAQVYCEARSRCPELGLPTVYRTLEILEKLQVIRRIHAVGGCEGFAPSGVLDAHHVVCVSCGRVAEFSGCNVSDLIPSVASQTGFHVEGHFLELLGTCSACQRSRAGSTHDDIPGEITR
jgi:Fur family ferric uptake transcriptional regulator